MFFADDSHLDHYHRLSMSGQVQRGREGGRWEQGWVLPLIQVACEREDLTNVTVAVAVAVAPRRDGDTSIGTLASNVGFEEVALAAGSEPEDVSPWK